MIKSYKTLLCTISLSVIFLGTTILSGCVALVTGSAVATGIMVAKDRRTTGTIIEDQSIALKARTAIREQFTKEDEVHVSIVSYNNNILLVGQTSSESQRERIEMAVHKIDKVQRIYNEIIISTPTSVITRSNDSWITTKVKSEMLIHKKINPTQIKVITEDSVVYLLGMLRPSEEEIAVNIARHIKGVKKVVKIIEHL